MSLKDVDIPQNAPPEEYSYVERRAELLQFILEAGHPDLLNQTEFAKRYGVSDATISRDMKHIRETVHDELGTDADLIAHTVFHKALREMARREDWETATETVERWFRWLFEMEGSGVQRAPSRLDADVKMSEEAMQTDDYTILADDEADAVNTDAVEVQPLPANDDADETTTDEEAGD